MKLNPPQALLDIAHKLERHGFETWAVGGAVRDALRGAPVVDWDLATRARPDDVRALFKRTVPVGIEHGTVGVLGKDGVLYEVTTFRRDIENFGRHAVVEFADTIDEDLSRRDFTINAIAWHPETDEVRDPFAGLTDLELGVLRTVGAPDERFSEDYLRVLRALRFAGQLELRIEEDTWLALAGTLHHLPALSAERVREELWKVLRKTRHASRTLQLYSEAAVLDQLYPELAAVRDIAIDEADHPWIISLRAVDAVPQSRLLVRLAALLHAVGMPRARTRDLRGGYNYIGHERIGARETEAIMLRLKASNADTERVSTLVGLQSELFPPDAPPAGVRRWLQHVQPDRVFDLFRLRIALLRGGSDASGTRDILERWQKAHAALLSDPVLEVTGLAIDGGDLKGLGLKPGPQFGEILRTLLDRVVERPELNTREELLRIAREELE